MANKKDSVKFTVSVERSIYDKMVQCCADSGLSKTAAVEHALDQYVNKYYKEQEVLRKYQEEAAS